MNNAENILPKKAMLVFFSASVYTGKKKDNRGNKAVSDKFGNDESIGNFTKRILPKEKTDKIQKFVSNWRNQVLYKYSTPWLHKGETMVPVANYNILMDKEREAKVTFEEYVNEFIAEYSENKRNQEKLLNGLYQETDYLSEYKLKKKFSWNIDFYPIPDSGNLLIDIVESSFKDISSNMDKMVQIGIQNSLSSTWKKVFDAVKALSDKLKENRTDKEGNDVSPIFRDSLIENIRDLVNLLPSLNIINDPALEQARIDLENDLSGIDPDDLRESKETRHEIVQKADKILSDIGKLF